MARDELQLSAAKRAYRNAESEGNRREEARWANVIGDILKNKGEYRKALRWLRIDYEVSNKYLPEKQLLPTCQSLGEVYLRLEMFEEALIYQKKHLELAKDTNDLIEQQRASTQLGRTYHEIFLKSDVDHSAARNAKKYFKSAMKLAHVLKENPPTNKSFLKEYIDAHNNIGMLEMDLDNLEAAEEILNKGLEICNEEEVVENDDGRSRLHNNLGSVYMELRKWDKAKKHIKKDIAICNAIGHHQGEAKGYINLGELHYRVQKYEEAILCYRKALDLAKSMEDEDALVDQIEQNIYTVKEAMKVTDEMKKEEQNLKKLSRKMVTARGTPGERKCLLQQNASLDRLIEKSSMIFAWLKHREFAKSKKRVASELCDKEKLSDAFLVIGESYQKLRDYKKAIKWYTKSWEGYKSIGNREGQALAKINIGDVLDCTGDWKGALDAFEEGYRIGTEAKLPSVQLSALENMHYSHMIRFDNVIEARRLQLEIDNLKESRRRELEAQNMKGECCSETDTEGNDHSSDSRTRLCNSREMCSSNSSGSKSLASAEEANDDVPLISLLRSSKTSPKLKEDLPDQEKIDKPTKALVRTSSELTSNHQTIIGRKRVRVIISDDEDEVHNQLESSKGSLLEYPVEAVATSNKIKHQHDLVSHKVQDVYASGSKFEESSCSYKSISPKAVASYSKSYRSFSTEKDLMSDFAASGSKCNVDNSEEIQHKHSATHVKSHTTDSNKDQSVTFEIDNIRIHIEAALFHGGGKSSMESLKVELACLYYLQLPPEKRSKGLLPIIQHMKCDGREQENFEIFEGRKDHLEKTVIEVSINGWVQKRLMKLYIDCCEELCEKPNIRLLKRLYISEVEDEVNVSDCELQDISITPLLDALHIHKTIAVLDFSHNLLGNGTMEKLKQFFTSSSQSYGALTLDLHCNRFGPTALFQICECPVLFTRLEILNISGNRLTDACGSYLSTILKNCKVLFSLNIERCCITSRTIQKIADALSAGSALSQLSIGYNNHISGNAVINLFAKLSTLKSFAELNMSGLMLNKLVVNSLCQLAKTSSLSRLMLGGTGLGTEGALQLTESLFCGFQEPTKLDLSYCGLTPLYIHKLNSNVTLMSAILELNVGGNPIMQEGTSALASLLTNPQCCLKVLVLNKCQLGLAGVLQIIQALADNNHLEELNLADNADMGKNFALTHDPMAKGSSEFIQLELDVAKPASEVCGEEVEKHQGLCAMNTECTNLEVADSEDDEMKVEAARSAVDNSCSSSCQRKLSLESQFILELSTAISMAKGLLFLDLSNNGFSAQASEALYTAWSSGPRSILACRHIKNQIVHLSVEGINCCRVKPCCSKD
ncbi:protein TONSOKU [Carica papaya]|uniref:protein TONSOKU n=1 Tax=Carica papaya TaxID=3649 RepID=UPI000B8CA1CA|nr:protein TONSOKU [Carica papaya]XP_021899948.1 protein TONSOKU [Carica papaya]